jgi:hypothetical protein
MRVNKTSFVSFRLTKKDRERLLREAKRKNITITNLVRSKVFPEREPDITKVQRRKEIRQRLDKICAELAVIAKSYRTLATKAPSPYEAGQMKDKVDELWETAMIIKTKLLRGLE